MVEKKNYISWIRSKVGKELIFLNFAVAVIFDESGRMLLQKRSDSKKWGLLGGHVELNESFKEGVIREVSEETGLTVIPYKLLGIYSDPKSRTVYPNGDVGRPVAVVFYCKIVRGKIDRTRLPKETLDLKYFRRNELPEIWNNHSKRIIKDAFKKKEAVCY